jgi:hypothetical protein
VKRRSCVYTRGIVVDLIENTTMLSASGSLSALGSGWRSSAHDFLSFLSIMVVVERKTLR